MMNFNVPGNTNKTGTKEFFENLDYPTRFLDEYTMLMIFAIVAVILLAAVIFFSLYCICTAGLIDSYNNITRGGTYRLGPLLKPV